MAVDEPADLGQSTFVLGDQTGVVGVGGDVGVGLHDRLQVGDKVEQPVATGRDQTASLQRAHLDGGSPPLSPAGVPGNLS